MGLKEDLETVENIKKETEKKVKEDMKKEQENKSSKTFNRILLVFGIAVGIFMIAYVTSCLEKKFNKNFYDLLTNNSDSTDDVSPKPVIPEPEPDEAAAAPDDTPAAPAEDVYEQPISSSRLQFNDFDEQYLYLTTCDNDDQIPIYSLAALESEDAVGPYAYADFWTEVRATRSANKFTDDEGQIYETYLEVYQGGQYLGWVDIHCTSLYY